MARNHSIAIHKMTLEMLPKFEMYETGSQIRRASKSIRFNIVEGYGRREYQADYLRFLTFAQSSCDETCDQIDTLWETGSLTNESMYKNLKDENQALGASINRFIQSIKKTTSR